VVTKPVNKSDTKKRLNLRIANPVGVLILESV